MVRIQIRAPFRQQFRSKDIWLNTHEDYYLDEIADRDELKYVLSPLFPYREFVYVEPSQIQPSLLLELSQDSGFTSVGGPQPDVNNSQFVLSQVEPAGSPLVSQETNQSVWDTTAAAAGDTVTTTSTTSTASTATTITTEVPPAGESAEPAVAPLEENPPQTDTQTVSAGTPISNPDTNSQPDPTEDGTANANTDSAIPAPTDRRQELNLLPIPKIKSIAASYGITYVDKPSTIEAILLQEK